MSDDVEKSAIELALEEIEAPEFAITKQLLSVHHLVSEDSVPVVAGVLPSGTGFDVYFKIKDERYFFVILILERSDGLYVNGSRMEASTDISLFITSELLTAEEITESIGLVPTQAWSKDDRHASSKVSQRVHKFTGWILSPDGHAPGEIGDKLERLLNLTEPFAPQIRSLETTCSIEISIAYAGYKDQMWGIPFTNRELQRMAALGAHVDIDLYAYGPDLPDEDE